MSAARSAKSTLGGYGEFSFSKYPGLDSSFDARRFVLFLYSPITDRISLATGWSKHGGNPVRRDGQLALGEALIEFAVVDVKIWEWLTLRAGLGADPDSGRLNASTTTPRRWNHRSAAHAPVRHPDDVVGSGGGADWTHRSGPGCCRMSSTR